MGTHTFVRNSDKILSISSDFAELWFLQVKGCRFLPFHAEYSEGKVHILRSGAEYSGGVLSDCPSCHLSGGGTLIHAQRPNKGTVHVICPQHPDKGK